MNLDDETFLTAYLDGTLGPGPRERAESALAADPRLADDLRALTAVRDLVAGLSRPPAPGDAAAAILARIERPDGWRRLAALPRRLPAVDVRLVRALIPLATAAALLAAVGLGRFGLGPGPDRPAVVRHPSAPRVPAPPRESVPLPDDPFVAAKAPADAAPHHAPAGRPRGGEAERFRKLFDSPNLQKVFVVTDVLGGDADRRVGALLDATPRVRPAFGRITVAQGIVIDPQRPGKATVYAVVVDDRELAGLPGLLARAFPGAVEEAPPRPGLLAQLAESEQVTILPGTQVAELREPGPSEPKRAIRTEAKPAAVPKSVFVPGAYDADPLHDPRRYSDIPEVTNEDRGPTPEQMRSGPHPMLRDLKPSVAGPPPADRADRRPAEPPASREPAAERRMHLVLVWVASPVG